MSIEKRRDMRSKAVTFELKVDVAERMDKSREPKQVRNILANSNNRFEKNDEIVSNSLCNQVDSIQKRITERKQAKFQRSMDSSIMNITNNLSMTYNINISKDNSF
jgi:hypothetical protein